MFSGRPSVRLSVRPSVRLSVIHVVVLCFRQGGHRALKVLEKKLSFFQDLESP